MRFSVNEHSAHALQRIAESDANPGSCGERLGGAGKPAVGDSELCSSCAFVVADVSRLGTYPR